MDDVHLYATGLDERARMAGVLPAILHLGPLDDERADGGGGLVGEDTHASTSRRVANRLGKIIKNETSMLKHIFSQLRLAPAKRRDRGVRMHLLI